ncbi:hypothetical protein N9H45_07595 [Opitutales bacterium]|nr:hypothetical protein [Opitutales bacterium]
MKKSKGIRKGDIPIIIRSIWWRQSALTLFLLVAALVFAFIDYVGPIISWICTVLFGLTFILSLLDQVFVWSRLRIDGDGYDLRTWFRRVKYRHQDIDSFTSQIYLNRELIILKLKKQAVEKYQLSQDEIPFPCSFGRIVEDIIKQLNKSLDKTPRKL